LIAIVEVAHRVDHHHPVAIPVQRDSDVGALGDDRCPQGRGCGRTDILVDVQAIGFGADTGDFGAQFMKDMWCNVVSRSVGTIHDDLQAPQIHFERKGALAELDVTTVRVIDSPRTPKSGRGNTGQRLVECLLDIRIPVRPAAWCRLRRRI
jgi:hypothetical protein